MVANELVEIFERLQLVESSFQSRADSKTKALAAGIFDDLFVRLPDIGAQLMRDCQSSGLVSRFTDIGIKILSDKVKLSKSEGTDKVTEPVDAQKQASATGVVAASNADSDGKIATALPDATDANLIVSNGTATAPANPVTSVAEQDGVESTMLSLLRMCEQQDSFIFHATDADSCGQLLIHVVSALEQGLTVADSHKDDVAARLSSTLHGGLTFRLLHLVLRFGCLWTGSMKAVALRLVKSLLN